MWSRLHSAADRLQQHVIKWPKKAFERAREEIKEAAAISSRKASETAYNVAQRARETVTRASKRTTQAAKEYAAITTTAAKEYASTKMNAAKESVKQTTLQSMESAKQQLPSSFRWFWWWSLAAVGVYGLAVSIPREIRVAIENRRNENVGNTQERE